MARIPLVHVEDMDSRQRAQYERFPSNLTRTLTLLDPRLSEALPATANALRTSGLDAGLREGVILRVAALTGSAYERMQHLDQARLTGWSDDAIAAIEAGDHDGLPDGVARVLRFVDALVDGGPVGDELFDATRAVLSDRDLTTVIVLVGHYITVALLTVVLDVDLDPEPDSWTHEH
ncbi:carboxymuconolactone decarboxylase family protein [Pseudonocardia sp. DR1-2]|uniref:carboxymuconolactone decarboxylase family protein n=1 Tax=Pseudonocardia sp. DR1-2 TaxID=2951168 RepID=UPI002043236A|nr:carboxymuconolactone decarboxylase family protein [Pseudonocardia sp. DR1-2]MCM3849003.1 carboxymuconolactone decarboxylase family protein [Pseudonocardia sp. DR1-2]